MKTKKIIAITAITTVLSTGFLVTNGSAASQTPAQLNKIITSLKKEVTQLKVSLSTAIKKIASLKSEITKKEATITANNKAITTFKADIAKKDATISANNKAIATYKSDIAKKDATITSQKNTITQKDAEIQELNKKIDELSPKADTSLPGHSITKPVGLYTPVTLGADDYYGKRLYDMTLTEVISGDQAWNIIKAENTFNDEPKTGFHYLLAKFKINNIQVLSKPPFQLSKYMFEAVSKDGYTYDSPFLVIPNAFSTKVYLGGTFEGYVAFEVKDGDSPLIVINQGDEDEGWFTTTN
ncbi:hypothetical protein V7146_17175 [Gottfriedia acidiceleris]|uniref:DUF4352 domain-containing protein n=1 Tax=Gottfriedia acidiceleris TaxID=371036 RepID=UPI00300022B4